MAGYQGGRSNEVGAHAGGELESGGHSGGEREGDLEVCGSAVNVKISKNAPVSRYNGGNRCESRVLSGERKMNCERCMKS